VAKPPIIPPPPAPEIPPPVPNQPPSNINPNAGLSHEEQQQFQLAAVHQGAGEEQAEEVEEADLAMSGLDDSDAARLVLGCAGLASAVAGGVYASRRRAQKAMRPSYVRFR
jgi:hypothetical protein